MKKAAASLQRIETLDLLRGYFLIVIILNHLHFYPSGLEWFTGQSFLYVSTAEGFFLISGIVLGIIRGAKLIDAPFKKAALLLWKRAGQLYVTSIILVLIFTLIGWLFVSNPGIKFGVYQPIGDFFGMFWQTITLQYTYGWADYLRLYAIFIFFSPLALWLLRKGWWYVVLLVSFGVWMLYPLSPWPEGAMSQPMSWQLIFFAGFVIGFHWKNIQAWWQNRTKRVKTVTISTVSAVALVTLIANGLIVFGDGIVGVGTTLAQTNDWLSAYFNKDRLPLLRILLFAIWFTALYGVVNKFEPQIKRYAGWLLLPFGTNSLYVYTIQAFIVFIVMMLFNQAAYPWFINLAISLAVVGLTYLAVRTKFLAKIIPR